MESSLFPRLAFLPFLLLNQVFAAGEAHLKVWPPTPAPGSVCLLEFRAPDAGEALAEVRSKAGPFSQKTHGDGETRQVSLVRTKRGRFVGLLGIDLEDPAGEWRVTVHWLTGPSLESHRKDYTFRVVPKSYPVQKLTLPPSKVDLSPANLKRVGQESAAIKKVLALETPGERIGPFQHPLDSGVAGTRFGSRRIINGKPRSQHSGADYRAKRGTPVHACAAGTVVFAEEHFFAGRSVFVDHGEGLVSMVCHLSAITVKVGQKVARGDLLGKVGATGRVTGPHLHFGVRVGGARVDPASLLALNPNL